MAAPLAPALRQSNDARFRYHVDVCQVISTTRVGVRYYRVRAVDRSDNTVWTALKTFDDFVALDAELRDSRLFHRSPFRKGRLKALPAKRSVLALWGRRQELWLGHDVPARLQQYLEDVLQRVSGTGVVDCHPVNQFLCTSIVDVISEHERSSLPFVSGQASGMAFSDVMLIPRDSFPELTRRLVQEVAPGIDVVVADDADTGIGDLSRLLEVQEGNGEPCVICHDDMELDDEVRALACGHRYHLDCISRWLTVRSACCLCLQPALPVEARGSDA